MVQSPARNGFASASQHDSLGSVARARGRFHLDHPLSELIRVDFLQLPNQGIEVLAEFSVTQNPSAGEVAPVLHRFDVCFNAGEAEYFLRCGNLPDAFVTQVTDSAGVLQSLLALTSSRAIRPDSDRRELWAKPSNSPAALATVLWALSDNVSPRSYRMMPGYGVNSFQWANEAGRVNPARFVWSPRLSEHAFSTEEAGAIAGNYFNYLRRDLYDAIENGHYPVWELGVQFLANHGSEEFSAIRPVGRMVLDRIPWEDDPGRPEDVNSRIDLVCGLNRPASPGRNQHAFRPMI